MELARFVKSSFMKIKTTPLLIALITFPALAEDIPGQNLLSYFSANCRSQGEWTRAALDESTALIESLRSLANDNDCKSVGGAVAQLGLLNQQLSMLANTNETKSSIAQLNAQEQELLIQISNNSDPATLASINATLRDLQLQRAGLIGKENSQKELAGADKVQMLSSVIQIANTSFAQITGNQRCLEKHPNVLKTATSIMSAVGATAAVVNPALGLGLSAGASFLGETIEGVRRYRNSREIRRISDNSIAQSAYKCALESMSERWCQMRDAESFLLFKANLRRHPILESGLGSAIRLNDREVPVLLEWLNKIRSGVTPTSTADAHRRNAVNDRESYVRSMEATGLGVIEENRKIFNTYPENEREDRWNIIKGLAASLTPDTPGFNNPYYNIYSRAYAPFYLIGIKETDPSIKNPASSTGYHTLDSWPGAASYSPNLDNVKSNFEYWVARARTRVNQELSQVLQPDALQTLSSAFDRTGNRWKISPMDSLARLIEFLENNSPQERDFAFRKLYASTLEKLKEIYRITEDAIIISDSIDGNTTTVERIYELAQLGYGTVVMEARLDMIVRLSLLELLRNSRPEDQVVVAQLLAAERFTETISKMSGTDNLAVIRADINRAQPITIGNLTTFMDIFGNNINRILAKLEFEERTGSVTVARSKRYARTEFCFLLLAVPEIDDYVDVKYCQGLQMKSVATGGPETQIITPALFKSDMNERACEYREFFRKTKIYETWGIK